MVLLPDKFNKHVQYAWRYDPCEIATAGGELKSVGQRRAAKPRAPVIDECITDDEFYDD